MSSRVIALVCFLVGVVVASAEYYWGDHWLYVNGGDKYLYPSVTVNVIVSAVVGAIASAATWALLELVIWMRRR